MSRLRVFALSDWLVLLAILTGFAGFLAVWPPLGMLYLAAVSWVLFALNEWRTPPEVPE